MKTANTMKNTGKKAVQSGSFEAVYFLADKMAQQAASKYRTSSPRRFVRNTPGIIRKYA